MLPGLKKACTQLCWLSLAATVLLLAGCKTADYSVLFPAGAVGAQERDLIVVSFLLMLFVLIPVVVLTLWFAWRYRAQNTNARYEPNWDHSGLLEVFLWGGPVVIIVILSVLTWYSTHALDPYADLKSDKPTLQVDAIAMDWKWLFVYPKYNVASVDEMAMPVDTPVSVNITSDTVMTAFMIPALGSQIFAMSGMRTNAHVLAKRTGSFMGKNYQYNGAGFHNMTFAANAMSESDFESWVAKVKSRGSRLDKARYAELTRPSDEDKVRYFYPVKDHLFKYVVGLYHSGKPRNQFTKTAER